VLLGTSSVPLKTPNSDPDVIAAAINLPIAEADTAPGSTGPENNPAAGPMLLYPLPIDKLPSLLLYSEEDVQSEALFQLLIVEKSPLLNQKKSTTAVVETKDPLFRVTTE
jgi:hypothetical protein